jgi:type II secretion system protein H
MAPRERAGFTLVELMMAVIALGMLATIVYISWEAVLPRTRLTTAVRELMATLQQARSDAISRGAPFAIEYYFEEGEGHPRGYRVITPFRAGGEGGLAVSDEERLALDWKPLPEGVEFQRITVNGHDFARGRVEVWFDARGSASDHVIVLVQRPYDNVYTIEVEALTGHIQFHDGEFVREPPTEGDFK